MPHQPPQGRTERKARKDIFSRELGYKDESNPFGDQSISAKFVWKKKNEYLQAAGLYRKSSKEQEIERIEYKVREIHAVKKRRDEREVERQLLEKQRAEHDKERHDEEYDEWRSREEDFHLETAKAKSLIRIEQGRERPIDLVAKGLAIAEGDDFEDMTILDKPPHQLFTQMTIEEVEDAISEIEIFAKNDSAHKSFWKAMLYVCNDAVEAKQRARTTGSRPNTSITGMGAGVAEGVVSEIHELLASKSRPELEDMMVEIKRDLQKHSGGMDTQFFDAVLSKIPLFIARSEIEEWHNKAIRRSEEWQQKKSEEEPPVAASVAGVLPADEWPDRPVTSNGGGRGGDWDDIPSGAPPERDDLSPVLEPMSVLEDEPISAAGAFSPVLEPLTAYDPEDLLDPEEDERILRQVRQTLVQAFGGSGGATGSTATLNRFRDDELFRQEKAKGMGDGEVAFNAVGKGTGDDFHGEVELPRSSYEWESKYAPRKPRFFNRVKTGYEWNKYNQTHYDHDNPPPKMVQGYKFNIFYPDLIDKTKAPTYYLEKGGDAETVILRFHAGPPYEDVAFKIVNREWNVSHKFGFRVVFDRGVLQLYFNFKRWRYRR